MSADDPKSTGAGAAASRRDAFVLAAVIVLVSVFHYITPPSLYYWHVLYQHLYYIPILLGAGWFGLRGGIAVSVISSILYLPHVVLHWTHAPLYRLSQLAGIALFLVFGAVAGRLIDRLRREREEHRGTALQLEAAYRRLQDTFERMRLLDRLSALGALSAGMAHEIRNPLGSIAGAIEILENEGPSTEEKREFVAILKKEIQRLSDIVTRHLDLVRPGRLERTPEDLAGIIRSVAALTEKQAATQGVALRLDLPNALPPLLVDGQQIRQAVLNLVINAVQALPGGGEARISLRSCGERIRITVEDDGPGLEPDAIGRVFEPFYTTKEGGTGLGLSIAFQIAEAHGGALRAENRPDGGARFTLELPGEAATGAPGPAPGGRAES